MPIYKYSGLTKDGAERRGVISAESRASGVQILNARGITPLSIRKLHLISQSVNAGELISFFTHLQFQHKNNVPILASIQSYIDISDNIAMQVVLENVYQSLRQGASLYEAFSAEKKVFGDIIPSLLQSAEVSGMLDSAIQSIVMYLSFRSDIKQRIRKTALYPAIVLIMAIISFFFCLICLAPQTKEVISDAKYESIITDFCLAIVPDENNIYIIIAVILLIACIPFILPKSTLLRIGIRLPITNKPIRKFYEWNCCTILYIALKSHIDIVNALKLLIRSMQSTPFYEELSCILNNVLNGIKFSDAIQNSSIIYRSTALSLKIGEENNELVTALQNTINLQNKEINFIINRLSTKLSVIITLITGVLLTILLLGMFYPLYSCIDVVKQ